MVSEQEWVQDKARFVGSVPGGKPPIGDSGSPLGPLAQQFMMLSQSLLPADTVTGVLQRIVDTARDIVPGGDLVSVTLQIPDGDLATPVATDPLAVRLDELQYHYGEGPCVDAARPGGPGIASSADLGAGREWPCFGPAAAELGVRAVLAKALVPNGDPPRTGALNIYSHAEHGLDQVDRDIALLFTAYASIALAATTAELEVTQLRQALGTRDVIGQAKGILMQRRGISADEAFDILRRTSQKLNIKLSELATTLASRYTEL